MKIIDYFRELKNSVAKISNKRPIIVTGKINGCQGIGSFYGEVNGVSCKIIKSYNNPDKKSNDAKIQFLFDLDTHKLIEIPLLNVYDDESLKMYGRNFPVHLNFKGKDKDATVAIELIHLTEFLYNEQINQNLLKIDIILNEDGTLNISLDVKAVLQDYYNK